MNNQETVEKLVNIYNEVAILSEDAKQVLADAKEAGLDTTLLSKIAKAKVKDKLGELEEQTSDLLALIEEVG